MELDLKAIETTLASGLPARARWMLGGATLDFAFSVDHLGSTGESDLPGLLAFGEQNYAEGGGARPWLCIRTTDGWVCGFDPDEDLIFLLNSSAERFVETFRFLNRYLERGEPLPPGCEKRLRTIDPEAYFGSDWRMLAENLQRAEPDADRGDG